MCTRECHGACAVRRWENFAVCFDDFLELIVSLQSVSSEFVLEQFKKLANVKKASRNQRRQNLFFSKKTLRCTTHLISHCVEKRGLFCCRKLRNDCWLCQRHFTTSHVTFLSPSASSCVIRQMIYKWFTNLLKIDADVIEKHTREAIKFSSTQFGVRSTTNVNRRTTPSHAAAANFEFFLFFLICFLFIWCYFVYLLVGFEWRYSNESIEFVLSECRRGNRQNGNNCKQIANEALWKFKNSATMEAYVCGAFRQTTGG